MRIKYLTYSGFTVFVLLFCGPSLVGQTDWGIEPAGATWGEFNAPPLPCLPPAMPYMVYSSGALPVCPPVIPFPAVCELGGTAFDNDGNFLSGGSAFPAVLNTDGFVIEMTDAATGGFLMSWLVGGGPILALPISGLGYDSAADIIWATDGFTAVGLGLTPSCTAPPLVVVPPFPLPLAGAPATGIDFDPCTGTVWFCDCAGFVVNCAIGGAPIGSFLAIPFISPFLTGITVNTATVPSAAGFAQNLQVTDGIMVAEFTSAGGLAAPGPYYLSANPFPVVFFGFPINGLGFSLRPNIYGMGCPSPAGTTPSIGWAGGYPFTGNAGFAITMTGATPGAMSYLVADISAACPPLGLPGCPGGVWVAFPWLVLIPLGPVPAVGSLKVPAPIPASPVPCGPYVGAPIFCQFINVISFGPTIVESSDAMSFTIGDS